MVTCCASHRTESDAALAGFEREASLLSEHLPTAVHRGAAGSARSLERLDMRAGVVHFIAHGNFDPDSPLEGSGLALPDTNGTPPLAPSRVAECRLTGSRAARLSLTGSHVTLRACVSGAVGEMTGREPLGMMFGLWQAGVQSVLAGQWDINLVSSSFATEAYYRAWLLDGLPRASAFAEAMRAVRKTSTEGWDHPYHWGGLALWGWWD